jgi:hypothetical protein
MMGLAGYMARLVLPCERSFVPRLGEDPRQANAPVNHRDFLGLSDLGRIAPAWATATRAAFSKGQVVPDRAGFAALTSLARGVLVGRS